MPPSNPSASPSAAAAAAAASPSPDNTKAPPMPLPPMEDILYPPPTSPEEAGALLGASITRLEPSLLSHNLTAIPPPAGMHSSFSTVRPVANSELYVRLASLRSLLRERAGLDPVLGEERGGGGGAAAAAAAHDAHNTASGVEPLPSAPSLLAVLMKLMGMTAGIAGSAAVVVKGRTGCDDSTLPVNVANPLGGGGGGGGGGIGGGGTPGKAKGNKFMDALNAHVGGAAAAAGVNLPHAAASRGVPVRLTPPLLSTAMRTLWVDCVILCYRLGDGLAGRSGPARVDVLAFLRRMMEVVGLNPRSQRAAGGTRLSALQVIAGLFADAVLARKVAPWAPDVLHLCHKALKSSGNNEPYYRLLAVRAATSVAVGCRTAALAAEEAVIARDGAPSGKVGTFLIQNAWEDKAIAECVKLMNRAADDRYPEVRAEAATFASAVAPLMIKSDRSSGGGGGGGGGGSSGGMSPGPSGAGASDNVANGPLSSLDDAMHIALKNLDDESAGVGVGWAEALARCICTSIEAGEKSKAEGDSTGNRHSADDGDGAPPAGSGHGSASSSGDFASKFKVFSEGKGGGRTMSYCVACTSVVSALDFLVSRFVKVGGEYSASKCGGAFSTGGRAVRVGISSAMVELLKLQAATNSAALSGSAATDVLVSVLSMVGPAMEQQLQQPLPGSGHGRSGSSSNQRFTDTLDVTSSPVARASDRPSSSSGGGSSLFSQNRKMRSAADSGIVRAQASRVLRRGLAEGSSEQAQQALLRELSALCRVTLGIDDGGSGGTIPLNRYQLQIVLIEASHLITALGEAATAGLEDALPVLQTALTHQDHGVRYEAAIALQATARAFPQEGRKTVLASLESLMEGWTDLVALAGNEEAGVESKKEESPTRRRRLIRRNKGGTSPAKSQSSAQMEQSLQYQYSVHGHALVITLLLHELPLASGGVSMEFLDKIITVAYSLVKCQDNELLAKAAPGAVCTCVRSGYGLICAALSTGPTAVSSHIAGFFRLWQASAKHAEEGTRHFSESHDLSCLDAMLVSFVAFLKNCSELLLSVPDALNRSTLLLENVFPLVSSGGRLGEESENPAAASRLDSAKASIMEAFAWLPPGSYAFAADQVFSFAALHIQKLTEEEVCCSIVGSLVTSEDKILDAHSFERATAVGQTGGSLRLEESLVALTSDPAHHSERESVLNTLAWKKKNRKESFALTIFESHILELSDTEEDRTDAPTPLHAVGTWKQPSSSSAASQVRLLDAAIHTFAATFGMQDGRAQERASRALGNLLPASLLQSAKSLSVTASSLIAENEKRKPKSRDEIAAASNISTTLLACLQALPLHEASTEDFISMGPPWMNRAKDLFFALLPSSVHLVRRAAAEGLSMLATLGVTEDAHTLQSSILHSLDELMKGNLPDGTVRKFQLNNDALSSVKAGSLLTLACIQRTAKRMDSDERDRARARSSSTGNDQSITGESAADTAPQTMIMLTRVLPYSLESDFFNVRTHALHALELLISYSVPEKDEEITAENLHILQKAVETIESNFLSAWTAITADFDGGREGEKFAAEPAFMAVLLRFMTYILPRLRLLQSSDCCAASRFSSMASLVMENSAMHPTVLFEGLVFFEKLSACRSLLLKDKISVDNTADPATSCIPFIIRSFGTMYPEAFFEVKRLNPYGSNSVMCQRAAVNLLRILAQSPATLPSSLLEDEYIQGNLLSILDTRCGSRHFQHSAFYRTISASRDAERSVGEGDALETEIVMALRAVYEIHSNSAVQVMGTPDATRRLLHLLLMCRVLIAGLASSDDGEIDNDDLSTPAGFVRQAELHATSEAYIVLSHSSSCRWQVRCHAASIACHALNDIARISEKGIDEKDQCPHFHPSVALASLQKQCHDVAACEMIGKRGITSFASMHLQGLIITACSTAIATSDQAELPSLQKAGLQLLTALVERFGEAADPESSEDELALQQYSSQIASGIRHALTISTAEGEIACEGLPQLFVAGCNALEVLTKTRIISDGNVHRRFARALLASSSTLPFVAFSDAKTKESPLRSAVMKKTSSLTADTSIPLLRQVLTLSTLSDLRLNADIGAVPSALAASLREETSSASPGAGIFAAALALDGARVLQRSIGFLCTTSKLIESPALGLDSSQPSGLTYPNLQDVDESVIAAMAKSWPLLANYAVTVLTDEKRTLEDNSDAIKEWVSSLSPLLIAGLGDSLDNISCDENASTFIPYSADVAIACTNALSTLLSQSNGTAEIDSLFAEDLQRIIASLKAKVILPALRGRSSNEDDEETERKEDEDESATAISPILIAQASKLLETLCHARTSSAIASEETYIGGKVLLEVVLLPLTALESGAVQLGGDDGNVSSESIDVIMSSSLRCSQHFISATSGNASIGDGVDPANLTRAMVTIVLSILTNADNEVKASAPKTIEAALGLLLDCIRSESIDADAKRQLAATTADAGCWEAWKSICLELEGETGLVSSVSSISKALGDWNDTTRQTLALKAIASYAQTPGADTTSIVGIVMEAAGAELMNILKAYGICSAPQGPSFDGERVAVCADVMKLIMMSLQQLCSQQGNDESQLSAFLAVVFEMFTSIISYNGLPNHPSGRPKADPSIGRICAQGIVFVVRSAPAAFKSAIVQLAGEDRTTLEMAVRADMTGYVVAQKAPAKKKLSLKGFK